MGCDAAVLVEREDELERLEELLAQTCSGTGAVVLIEGPAGIGKTSLLDAVRRRAHERGALVLAAGGGALERDFAFGVARQLLEAQLTKASPAARRKLLAGPAALSGRIFVADDAVEDARALDAGASFPVLHGLYWLCANLAAASPVLLAVDDVHWADAPSLRFLLFLARRLEGLPVLLALAARPGEDVQPALGELGADARTHVLRPATLTGAAVGKLVRDQLGDTASARFCASCAEITGGNPFLLTELLRELAADHVTGTDADASRLRDLGPDTVRRAVLVRIGRLGVPATELARAVAVLGDDADLMEAAALARLDVSTADRTADALAGVDVLRRGRPLTFAHPILRTVVYADIADAARAGLHARAAELLKDAGAEAERVATHLLGATPTAAHWVAPVLRQAAATAAARGAPELAVAYLRRALTEPAAPEGRAGLLLELGSLELHTDVPQSIVHLTEGLEIAADPAPRAAAALALTRALVLTGQTGRAAAALEAVADSVGRGSPALGARLDAELVALGRLDPSLRVRVSKRLRAFRPSDDPDEAECVILATLAQELVEAGDSRAEAVELAQRALAPGVLASDEVKYIATLNVLVCADEFELTERYAQQMLADARRKGSVVAYANALLAQTGLHYRLGAMRDAEADAHAGLDAGLEHGWYVGVPLLSAALIDALVERGELAAAADVLYARGFPDALPEHLLFLGLLGSRGRLRIAQGAVVEGLGDLLEQGRRCEATGAKNPAYCPWRSNAALAMARLDRHEEADRLAEEELGLARAWGAPRAVGNALLAAGLVKSGDERIELLGEAVAALTDSPARLIRARALVSLGVALRGAGRRAESREQLRAGLELARECGADELVKRAHEELLAAGARPQRLAFSGLDALTASERRIADMAVDGLSNREIAQTLFVTIKTVEMHLANAYRKLAIHSRSELEAALGSARAVNGR